MPSTLLPQDLLTNLLNHFQTPDTIAVALSGSFARDEATPFSDVDLLLFMQHAEACQPDYELHYHSGFLVSLSRSTIAQKQKDIQSPHSAIWAVKGIQQAKILYDPTGKFAALQQAAHDFAWEPLQPSANQYASENLRGLIEEAHKILTGLHSNDESTTYYATLGMILSLPRLIAVQHGLLMLTENEFVRKVQESVGLDSEWTRIYRIAAGLEYPKLDQSPVRWRALATLDLYTLTVELLRHILWPDDRKMIDHALHIIHQVKTKFSETT